MSKISALIAFHTLTSKIVVSSVLLSCVLHLTIGRLMTEFSTGIALKSSQAVIVSLARWALF